MSKKTTAQAQEPKQDQQKRYRGPWWKLEADALHSRSFTGRVDLGTYSQPEVDSGALARRIQALQAEGYKNITTREIAAENE